MKEDKNIIKMVTCKACNGKGTMTVTVRTLDEPDVKFEAKCFGCSGTGKMTKQQLENYNWENKLWCKCENSPGSRYVPDNVGIISKHHYLCNKCNKITQIG